MRRRLRLLCVTGLLALTVTPAALAAVQVTPVGRVPFPERRYLVDLERDAAIAGSRIRVSENDAPIGSFKLRPLASSAIHTQIVLAIDASKSMAGAPFEAALDAARAFAATRAGREEIGVVTFNSDVTLVQRPTASAETLGASLKNAPGIASGTHIYDAVMESLAVLQDGRAGNGVIVLLSDGADVGSSETLESVADAARQAHVRIFSVGLASTAYDAEALRSLANETGGAYFEAASAVELNAIYSALGRRLANQYLLEYRSRAVPKSSVTLRLEIPGVGSTAFEYTAPPRSEIAPFHRPLFKRLLLSPATAAILSLLLAVVFGGLVALLLKRRQSDVAGRLEQFLAGVRPSTQLLKTASHGVRGSIGHSARAQGWMGRVERDLEVANVDISAATVVGVTVAATVLVSFLFALASPVLVVLSLTLIPLASRAWVRRKLAKTRDSFADQLPANLQVLASALRAGYSLSGALAVSVENANEPSRKELRRAVNDEQLGIPIDEALRRVAERMENRDLQQVALLSELQRTAGGNAAEVLDTVVETIRERTDVRRLVQTLTAQGRMARWILTALPAAVALILWLMQPSVMTPFFTSTGGQVALVIAALMTTAGSLIIQRMVNIEV